MKEETGNWIRQEAGKAYFESLVWSKPENRAHAGKLLIIGGNTHGFAMPAQSYSIATKSGAGAIRVILPESLRRTISQIMPEAEFAPTTPSGSFSQQSLLEFLQGGEWADAILLAGDFGRNSETAIVLEKLADKFAGQIIIGDDGVDYFLHSQSKIFNRSNSTLVINLGKLQKLLKLNRPEFIIRHSMSLIALVEILQQLTIEQPINMITKHEGYIIAACGGKVSTTPSTDNDWQNKIPAIASVWLMQNPSKQFEALTTAVFEIK